MRRQPEALSDATIQPIMFVLLFALRVRRRHPGARRRQLPRVPDGRHLRPDASCSARSAWPSRIANDRKNQAVDRFRSLPIAQGAVLGGHAVANLLKALLPIVLMSITGLIIGWRIHSGVVDAAAGYVLMIAFAFAMIWIGVLLGSVVATPEGVHGHRLRRALPAHVHRPARSCRSSTMPAVAADDRRVEPGHDAGRRAAQAVRQPRRPTRGRASRGRSSTRSPTR